MANTQSPVVLCTLTGPYHLYRDASEPDYVVDRKKQTVTEPAPAGLYSPPSSLYSPPASVYTTPKGAAEMVTTKYINTRSTTVSVPSSELEHPHPPSRKRVYCGYTNGRRNYKDTKP